MRSVKFLPSYNVPRRQPVHSFGATLIVAVLMAAIAVATPTLIEQLAR